MLDTIRIESPILTTTQANIINDFSILRCGMDIKKGNVIYSFVTSELAGSYENKIMLNVREYQWINLGDKPIKVKCSPYVILEGSISKAINGHNIDGSVESVILAVKYMVKLVEEIITDHIEHDFKLPDPKNWEIQKLDYAKNYQFESKEQIKNFFNLVYNTDYSRRKILRYDMGIHIPGSTTTVKFYHKGSEFKVHDKKKLKNVYDDLTLYSLQKTADKLLRVEVSAKKRKLKGDFGNQVKPEYVEGNYLKMLFDYEVDKFLKRGKIDMKEFENTIEIENYLTGLYGNNLGKSLFSTWIQLITLGESHTRSKMERSTYYRHSKKLREAGLSLTGYELKLEKSLYNGLPQGLKLDSESSYIYDENNQDKNILKLVS